MKTKIDWLVAGKVVYAQFPIAFEIDEWYQAGEQFNCFLDQGKASVHIITDLLTTEKHPINPIEIIRGASWLHHPRFGWNIHITDSKVQKLLAMITVQRFVARYRVFESLTAGMEFLKDIDDSLQNA